MIIDYWGEVPEIPTLDFNTFHRMLNQQGFLLIKEEQITKDKSIKDQVERIRFKKFFELDLDRKRNGNRE